MIGVIFTDLLILNSLSMIMSGEAARFIGKDLRALSCVRLTLATVAFLGIGTGVGVLITRDCLVIAGGLATSGLEAIFNPDCLVIIGILPVSGFVRG